MTAHLPRVACMHCPRFNPRCEECVAESKAELRRIEAEEAAEESRQQEEEE